MAKIKIDSKAWYTLSDVVRLGMFPWCSSFSTVRKIVQADAVKKNLLKSNIQGDGRATKYHLKGENIIKFIKAVEDGKVTLQ